MANALSDNRQWRSFDWGLLAAVLLLVLTGLSAIFSATHGTPEGPAEVQRQFIYLVPATIAMLTMLLYDYGWLFNLSRWIYWGNIGLLAAVLFAGHSALGAQRWINLGFMTIQPSEFAKLALIITLAKLLSMRSAKDPRVLWAVALHVLIPFALIFKQPDLGTSLVFCAITLGMLFWSGLPGAMMFVLLSPLLSVSLSLIGWPLWVAYLVGLVIWLWRQPRVHVAWKGALVVVNTLAAFAIPLLWGLLKPYQRQRLVVFMNPEADPLGSGYHIIQSKVAIGSGGLAGKGYMEGTQTQLHFIPEQHTDFIFSVVGEEFGFLGGVVLVSIFLLLVWRGVMIAMRAKDTYGSLMAIGIVSMFLFHFFVNIGMTIGIMPVTGIPLPFISAGGTSLLTNAAAIGLLLSVSIRRRKLIITP
ncbi:MAG: rod shape-determining protein RodA [Candidatus Sericytochromatia bacterium]|nr:rod shape-determining protein RodA [Candidatus Sericytochromatia bacterium]